MEEAAVAAAAGRHGLQAAAVPRAARRVVLATGPVEAALALLGAAVARADHGLPCVPNTRS